MATIEQLYVGIKTSTNQDQQKQTLGDLASLKIPTSLTRDFVHERTPTIITTREQLHYGGYIRCWCNPSEANWSMSRRESMQKTAAGMVRNTWRNRSRDTYYDNFPVAFTFQAGNIMPSAPYNFRDAGFGLLQRLRAAAQVPLVPPGLNDFYKFLALTDSPALLGSQPNYHIVIYNSRVFPQLWMEGWFQPDGPSFTDSSQNGNTVTWTHTFLVVKTFPKLTTQSLMSGLYSDWVKNSGALGEALPSLQLQRQMAGLDVADIWANPYAVGGPGSSSMPSGGGPSKAAPQAAARTKDSGSAPASPITGQTTSVYERSVEEDYGWSNPF